MEVYAMSNRFVFVGFEDSALNELAARRLSLVMDGAPYDSSSAALIERLADGYYASIDVYSTSGPFAVRTHAPSAREAMDRALARLDEKLQLWRARKFERPLPEPGVA
jgi:hypothetical protein